MTQFDTVPFLVPDRLWDLLKAWTECPVQKYPSVTIRPGRPRPSEMHIRVSRMGNDESRDVTVDTVGSANWCMKHSMLPRVTTVFDAL